MYVPKHFEQTDPALLLEVMQSYNFATVVSQVDGAQFATHVPVLVRRSGTGAGANATANLSADVGTGSSTNPGLEITGHFARANPHWRGLQTAPEVLVIFHGPHTYISPTLYAGRDRVPTWNYIAVHASGIAKVDQADPAKLAILEQLIQQHEPSYQAQFDALEPSLRAGLMHAIVGFSIKVDRLQGKFKLGQHRLPQDGPGMQEWHAGGGENERAINTWMQRLGYWP
jgi:transcriptional regulator